MHVSVVVVCYNEEKNLPDILGSLARQTYPAGLFEVVVVDNNSQDRTFGLAREFAQRFPNFKVTRNPRPGIAPSRNVGLRESRFDHVAFTDADCIVAPDWLERLVAGYERYKKAMPDLVAVGGGNTAHDPSDPFLKALAITLNSFWGSHGSMQGLLLDKDTEVSHIPTVNILYERKAVLDQGGFDEAFGNICEDPELNHRLCRAGRRFMFLSGVVVLHKLRPNLKAWLKNVFTYGKGRSWLIRKHPDHFRMKFAAPPLILLGLLASPLALWRPALAIFPLVYLGAVAAIALKLARREQRLDLWPRVWTILLLNPIFYGLGQIYGALYWRGR